jgi:polysaccharide biosynthesis/export protein
MKTIGFFSFLLSFFLLSCKTQNLLEQPKEEAQFQHKKVDSAFLYDEHYEYQICKDDKVSMSIWDHDNMSIGSLFGIYNSNEVYGKWVMVDAQGNITVPKVGKFHIKDLTVIQAKDSLTKIFSKWIINPVIELKVLNKEITILGELKTPGKYVVERDMNSLLDIIARAGDFEMYANKKSIKIIRQKGNEVRMINVDLTASNNYFNRNLQVHPGDLIVVPSKKSKDFERRISAIIPIATSVTAATLLVTTLL